MTRSKTQRGHQVGAPTAGSRTVVAGKRTIPELPSIGSSLEMKSKKHFPLAGLLRTPASFGMTAAYIIHSQYGIHKHTAVFAPQSVTLHRGASLLSFRIVLRRFGFPERSVDAV